MHRIWGYAPAAMKRSAGRSVFIEPARFLFLYIFYPAAQCRMPRGAAMPAYKLC